MWNLLSKRSLLNIFLQVRKFPADLFLQGGYTRMQAEVHTVPFTAIKHCCLQRYIFPDLGCINHCSRPRVFILKNNHHRPHFPSGMRYWSMNAMERARTRSQGSSARSSSSQLPYKTHPRSQAGPVIEAHRPPPSQNPWLSYNWRGRAVCLFSWTDVWAESPQPPIKYRRQLWSLLTPR